MIIQNGKTIHLQTKNVSYVMYRNEEEDLLSLHFGRRIAGLCRSGLCHRYHGAS